MLVEETENFPRGGKKPISKPVKRKQDDNLFSTGKSVKRFKNVKRGGKGTDFKLSTDDNFQSRLKLEGTLAYRNIKEGMVVLGRIFDILNCMIKVEFPGSVQAKVPITNISEPFVKNLGEKLKDDNNDDDDDDDDCLPLQKTFKIGELVVAKIMQLNDEHHSGIVASVNPTDVNAEKSHVSFKKGMLAWGCIQSESEHGYEVSFGVNNCRVFLPHKNIDKDVKYSIGEVFFCVIHKSSITLTTNTIIISTKKEHLNQATTPDDCTLNDLIPGFKVDLLVEKITTNGVKGEFLNKFFGYIDRTQLFSIKTLDNIKEASTLKAYVLFVEPITKVTHLSLKGIEKRLPAQLKIGSIMDAIIDYQISKGLVLKINEHRGFISNKRLLNACKDKNMDENPKEIIKKHYPIGSKHKCRILHYVEIDENYVCSFEENIINEKYFTSDDLKLGQLINNVEIEKICSNGIAVNVGHVKGFIPNLHLSNSSQYSDTIKNKFTIGMNLKARVLTKSSNGSIIFTLKKDLIDSDICLTSYNKLIIGEEYVGFIAYTIPIGALVIFYNNVKGFIPAKEINKDNSLNEKINPQEYFFQGQVVHVWYIGKFNEKYLFTIHPPNIKAHNIKVGDYFSGTIIDINENHLDVEINDGIKAIVPLNHLASDLNLCPALINSFKIGDKIDNLMCIKNLRVPVLSRREGEIFKLNKNLKIFKFNNLKAGNILRCSFEKIGNGGFYVSPLIKGFKKNILIKDDEINEDKYKYQQAILGRIIDINKEKKKLILNTIFPMNVSLKFKGSFNKLINLLNDYDFMVKKATDNNLDISELKPGMRIKGEVEFLSDNDCFLKLPKGIKGVVTNVLKRPKLNIGDEVEAIVLFQDFANNSIDVCLKNKVSQKINEIQNGEIKKPLLSTCLADILLKKDNFILGVLRGEDFNGQFIYFPTYFHENDTEGMANSYKKIIKIKVFLYKIFNCKILGAQKKLVKNYDETLLLKKNNKDNKKGNEDSDEEMIINLSSEDESNDESETEVLVSDEKQEEKEEEKDEEKEEEEEENDETKVNNKKVKPSPKITILENKIYLPDNNLKRILKGEENNNKDNNNDENVESIMPSMDMLFSVENENKTIVDVDSDEEDEEEQPIKKKKLTPSEKLELAKKDEERISKIEKELMEFKDNPQTADHFDRLLLANPNSSELWTKYIAFHVSNTELEKARAVGKKALETISIAETNEKFNVWIALLNLENMYGTKEAFDKLFEDAIKFNDSLDIYINVINMLAQSGKYKEMEEKIKKIRSKEKQNIKMWLEIGKCYYTIGELKEARNLKEMALKSITIKKIQLDLMVRFAIMEFKYGELDQAIANFETILDTYPNKVNIWTIYVDQLIKKNVIDMARKVLERAVTLKLPIKSMKSLFQKYIGFEEKFGTNENIEKIKRQANNYINSFYN